MPKFETLHHPWLFKLLDKNSPEETLPGMDDLDAYETYDTISCITIEKQYQKYIHNKKSE